MRDCHASHWATTQRKRWSERHATTGVASMTTATIGYAAPAMNYQVSYERATEDAKPRRSRRSASSRRSTRPTGFNGLHRRRRKRWTW
jgi:hypothetical protein